MIQTIKTTVEREVTVKGTVVQFISRDYESSITGISYEFYILVGDRRYDFGKNGPNATVAMDMAIEMLNDGFKQ